MSIFFESIYIMSSSNIKRRRTTTSNDDDKHITDLPDGLLVGISSLLVEPSVALFAIAMNTNATKCMRYL